jgi:hypothetical protein
VLPPSQVDPRALRACLGRFRPAISPSSIGLVVERVGVTARSLTFRPRRGGEPGRYLYGCDQTAGRNEFAGRPPWCSAEVGDFGSASGARLRDPRLDVLCNDASGRRVATAWLDPLPAARWLAVRGPVSTELYRVAAGLPVRVATSRAGADRATLRVAQYAASGALLARSILEVRVAG